MIERVPQASLTLILARAQTHPHLQQHAAAVPLLTQSIQIRLQKLGPTAIASQVHSRFLENEYLRNKVVHPPNLDWKKGSVFVQTQLGSFFHCTLFYFGYLNLTSFSLRF